MSTEKIAVMVDSGCDIAPECIEKYGLWLLPLHIDYPEKAYLEGWILTRRWFTTGIQRLSKDFNALSSGGDRQTRRDRGRRLRQGHCGLHFERPERDLERGSGSPLSSRKGWRSLLDTEISRWLPASWESGLLIRCRGLSLFRDLQGA